MRTPKHSAMVRLIRDVLGLELAHERRDFVVFRMSNGDTGEVFGPSDAYHGTSMRVLSSGSALTSLQRHGQNWKRTGKLNSLVRCGRG